MFCRKCGKKFEGKFCPNCGTSTEETTKQEVPAQEARSTKPSETVTRPKKGLHAWAIAAITLFACIIWFSFSTSNFAMSFFVVCLIGVLVYLVMGIVAAIKKQKVATAFIAAGVCFVLTIIGFAPLADSTSEIKKTDTPPVSSSSISEVSSQPAQATIATIGETMDYDGLKITLDSAEYYTDNSSYKIDEAETGKIYVVLRFTALNETGEDQYINMFYEDSYCDDVAIDPENMMMNLSGESIWGDVANGKKRKGYVAYQVPENWESLEFYYNPEVFGGDSSKMMFKVTPSDIE